MKRILAAAFCCIVTLVVSTGVLAQGRRIRKIERPVATAATTAPLPTDEQCRAAVFEVARRYSPREIATVLHPEFPNRDSLIDAMRRADLRVTNMRLEIESIESTKLLPWSEPAAADRRAAAEVARAPATRQVESPRTPPLVSGSAAGSVRGDGLVELSSVSDCIADVQTRLVFESSDTGARTVLPAGRAEWRLRFAR